MSFTMMRGADFAVVLLDALSSVFPVVLSSVSKDKCSFLVDFFAWLMRM